MTPLPGLRPTLCSLLLSSAIAPALAGVGQPAMRERVDREIDGSQALAKVRDGELNVSMVCSFSPEGALTRCQSDDRLLRFTGEVPSRWVSARWVMERGDYRQFGTLRLPTVMSVRWLLPEGEFEQVRAKTVAVDFDVAARYPAQ